MSNASLSRTEWPAARVAARLCAACGRQLTDLRSHAATCSARCRLRLWRGRLSESVSRGIVVVMSHERPSLSRPEVAELLNLQPKEVRALEVEHATSGFPRPTELAPLVLRWRRSEVLAWASQHPDHQFANPF